MAVINCGEPLKLVEKSNGVANSVAFRVWDASRPADFSAWVSAWNNWPDREVFCHPAYLQLFQTENDRILCASYESSAGRALYPFQLRDLRGESFWSSADGPATDLTSPMGYGGPVGWDISNHDQLMSGFWSHFDEWAHSVGVVSEFARLSLFTENLIDSPCDRQFRQLNVVRSLNQTDEQLWMEFRHKVRKNVNRAVRNGIRVEVDPNGDRIKDFLSIYSSTMDRRNAAQSFRFDKHFLTKIREHLAGQFAYFHAFHGGHIISTELVLISANHVYSWLGGTDENSFELRPNDLLKVEIMRWARSAGKKTYVLGGGAAPDDGIFRYKLSFAPSGTKEYYLRRRIVDEERYRAFAERAARFHSEPSLQTNSGFFPAYHAA